VTFSTISDTGAQADREARLPVWARRELQQLRQSLQEAETALSGTLQEGDGYANPYGEFPRPVVEKGGTVRFPLDGRPIRETLDWIDVRLRDGELEIMGAVTLLVRPQASNVVGVQIGRLG
jgi:hypothetical protein